MTATLSIVLDRNDPGQPKWEGDGSAAYHFAELVLDQTLAPRLRPLERYIELLYPEDEPIEWASPAEGFRNVEALRALAARHPNSIESADKLEADLAYFQRMLDHAEKFGARWMFCLDT